MICPYSHSAGELRDENPTLSLKCAHSRLRDDQIAIRPIASARKHRQNASRLDWSSKHARHKRAQADRLIGGRGHFRRLRRRDPATIQQDGALRDAGVGQCERDRYGTFRNDPFS